MRRVFTGDQHLGHELLREKRGFPNLAAMEECLIANHNAVVRRDDVVIHLGDFAHRMDDDKRLRKLFGALNGSHHLVIGNHDDKRTLALGWAGQPAQMLMIKDGETRICAMHYAMRTWPGIHRGVIHLYGHSHNRIPADSMSCDVGVDAWGLFPVTLPQITARLAVSPPHADPETQDFDGGELQP